MAQFSLGHWLREHPRHEALIWASPYLLFVLIPLGISIYKLVRGEAILWGIPVSLLAIAVVYVSSWLMNPVSPQGRRPHWKVLATAIAFLAIQIFYYSVDPAGAPFMLSFLAAMVSLQFPIRWVLPTGLAVVMISTVQSWEGSYLYAPLTIIATAGLTFFIRHNIEYEREHEIAAVKQRQAKDDQHRNRLAADLHDILGQSLTTISVKAQLAQRLLEGQEGERVEQAGTQISEIAVLARHALDDVRKVVTSTKEISVDSELTAAQELLRAAGINTRVELRGIPNAGVLETNAAYVIREACANIIHHSATDAVDINLSESAVRIFDHGPAAPASLTSAHSGSGLTGLRQRIGDNGVLVAEPRDGGWFVEYRMGEQL